MNIPPAGSTALALVTALAFAAAPAAAQQEQQQTPVAGTYELIEIGGNPLPFTVDEEDQCVERVTAGTLTLQEDGSWSIELTEEETCGEEVSEEAESEEGNYTVDGTSINFRPDEEVEPAAEQAGEEPDEIDVDELQSGTVEGETIRVQIRDTEAVAIFRRTQG